MRCKHTAKMVQPVTKCPLTFFFVCCRFHFHYCSFGLGFVSTTFASRLSVSFRFLTQKYNEKTATLRSSFNLVCCWDLYVASHIFTMATHCQANKKTNFKLRVSKSKYIPKCSKKKIIPLQNDAKSVWRAYYCSVQKYQSLP